MHSQNTTLKGLNDSTSFYLHKEFKKEFADSSGVISPSAIKIQLQYELLSVSFMRVDTFSDTKNDAEY